MRHSCWRSELQAYEPKSDRTRFVGYRVASSEEGREARTRRKGRRRSERQALGSPHLAATPDTGRQALRDLQASLWRGRGGWAGGSNLIRHPGPEPGSNVRQRRPHVGSATLHLHPGQRVSRDIVCRRDIEPSRSPFAASQRPFRGLHQTVRCSPARLVRDGRHHGGGDRDREAYQALASRLENRADRAQQSDLG